MLNTIKKALLMTSLSVFFVSAVNAEEAVAASKRVTGYEKVELKMPVPHIKFDKEDPLFPDGYFERLKGTLDSFGEHRELVIEVVGHSDSARLGAASRAKWGSNLGLSKLRAANAIKEIKKRINVEGVEFTSRGAGASEPLVENNSPQNKAKNRRGETNISYEKPIYEEVEVVSAAPTPIVAPVPVPVVHQAEDQARDALAVSDEDEDANTLEEALTAVDQNYSLIKKKSFGLHYGHSFSYSSSDSILLSTQNADGVRTPIGVSRDARYTHSTNLSGSYGLLNNLTLGTSLPFVSSVRAGTTTQDRAEDDGIGDISVSLRWQPWPVRLGAANTTVSTSLTLPTGTSPYKIDTENSVSTGSGTPSYSLGINFNKTIDPIIAYGGISVGRAFDKTGLNQKRGDQFLQSVRPKLSLSYSMGIGYALSYGVSLNMGLQHSFGSKTVLEFSNKSREEASASTSSFESVGGHNALFNISAGFRTSPGTVMSVNLAIGLTRDSPDFVLGFSLPFSIEGLKSYFVEE